MKNRNRASGPAVVLDSEPKLLAQTRFSKSMAEALCAAFEHRSEDDVLILEIRDFGVWLVDKERGRRQFIGSVTPRNSLS